MIRHLADARSADEGFVQSSKNQQRLYATILWIVCVFVAIVQIFIYDLISIRWLRIADSGFYIQDGTKKC